jgi:hypothetical protein
MASMKHVQFKLPTRWQAFVEASPNAFKDADRGIFARACAAIGLF